MYGVGPIVKQQGRAHDSHFRLTFRASYQLNQCSAFDYSVGIQEPNVGKFIQSRRSDPHIAAPCEPQVAAGTNQSNRAAVHDRWQSLIDTVDQPIWHGAARGSVRIAINTGLPAPTRIGLWRRAPRNDPFNREI